MMFTAGWAASDTRSPAAGLLYPAHTLCREWLNYILLEVDWRKVMKFSGKTAVIASMSILMLPHSNLIHSLE